MSPYQIRVKNLPRYCTGFDRYLKEVYSINVERMIMFPGGANLYFKDENTMRKAFKTIHRMTLPRITLFAESSRSFGEKGRYAQSNGNQTRKVAEKSLGKSSVNQGYFSGMPTVQILQPMLNLSANSPQFQSQNSSSLSVYKQQHKNVCLPQALSLESAQAAMHQSSAVNSPPGTVCHIRSLMEYVYSPPSGLHQALPSSPVYDHPEQLRISSSPRQLLSLTSSLDSTTGNQSLLNISPSAFHDPVPLDASPGVLHKLQPPTIQQHILVNSSPDSVNLNHSLSRSPQSGHHPMPFSSELLHHQSLTRTSPSVQQHIKSSSPTGSVDQRSPQTIFHRDQSLNLTTSPDQLHMPRNCSAGSASLIQATDDSPILIHPPAPFMSSSEVLQRKSLIETLHSAQGHDIPNSLSDPVYQNQALSGYSQSTNQPAQSNSPQGVLCQSQSQIEPQSPIHQPLSSPSASCHRQSLSGMPSTLQSPPLGSFEGAVNQRQSQIRPSVIVGLSSCNQLNPSSDSNQFQRLHRSISLSPTQDAPQQQKSTKSLLSSHLHQEHATAPQLVNRRQLKKLNPVTARSSLTNLTKNGAIAKLKMKLALRKKRQKQLPANNRKRHIYGSRVCINFDGSTQRSTSSISRPSTVCRILRDKRQSVPAEAIDGSDGFIKASQDPRFESNSEIMHSLNHRLTILETAVQSMQAKINSNEAFGKQEIATIRAAAPSDNVTEKGTATGNGDSHEDDRSEASTEPLRRNHQSNNQSPQKNIQKERNPQSKDGNHPLAGNQCLAPTGNPDNNEHISEQINYPNSNKQLNQGGDHHSDKIDSSSLVGENFNYNGDEETQDEDDCGGNYENVPSANIVDCVSQAKEDGCADSSTNSNNSNNDNEEVEIKPEPLEDVEEEGDEQVEGEENVEERNERDDKTDIKEDRDSSRIFMSNHRPTFSYPNLFGSSGRYGVNWGKGAPFPAFGK